MEINNVKEKIKILSISKRNYRSEFIFPKEQKLFDILKRFLINLSFNKDGQLGVDTLGRPCDKMGEYIFNKEEDINLYNEKIENYANENYSVDIIYFDKKVVVILNYKKDRQKEIGKSLKGLIFEENVA